MADDFDDRLRAANAQLKAARVRVTIRRRGDSLSLRATLPPRPESDRLTPYQQDLPLGIKANPAGLRLATARAKSLGAAIDESKFTGRFEWDHWEPGKPEKGSAAGEAIVRFEAAKRPQVYPNTWLRTYLPVLKNIPTDEPLTAEVLRELIASKPANSRSRQVYAIVLRQLASQEGIDLDLSDLPQSYSPQDLAPRTLPTDEQIIATRNAIANPRWQYLYGLLAACGLRDHEAFFLDPATMGRSPGAVRLLEGKTADRQVYPCYPEWWEEWKLWRYELLPKVSGKHHGEYGERVSRQFARYKLGKAYDLRHAYAVRCSIYGWPVEIAARLMGHSVDVHTRAYQRWIDKSAFDKIGRSLHERNDRPKPPI